MLTNKAVDLKNVYIVFKRVKKQNWYHRGPNYQVCSTVARQAVKFATKEEAVTFCAKLNEGRKSYRFKVETASKHFVNNWSIGYESWNKQVVINSQPIGLDRLSKLNSYEKYNPTLDNQKSKVIDVLNTQIEEFTKDIKETDSNLTESLNRAKRDYENAIKYANERHIEQRLRLIDQQSKLVGMKDTLSSTDLDIEYVEKFGT